MSDDDAQFVLSQTNITGNRKSSLDEQLAIRAGCLRNTVLGNTGRRQRGSVGKLKTQYRNGELVILKRFGRPTYVLTHKSPDSTVADFEFIAPRSSVSLFIPMRFHLAYGVWTEEDGARVLFSRDYKPLWRLRAGERPARVNPWDWIQFGNQEWFWNDVTTPWSDKIRYANELRRLEDFGVTGLPRLVETLPHLVLRDDLRDIKSAVEMLRHKYEPAEAA